MMHNNTVYVTEETPTWDFFDSLALIVGSVTATVGTVVFVVLLGAL